MKGFLITVGLIIGASIWLLTNYAKVGAPVIEKVAAQENGRESILKALEDGGEKAFVAKYLPLLERRWTVARISLWLDEDYFMVLSEECVTLYDGTPLELIEPFGRILFERAKRMELLPSVEKRGEAFFLYKRHLRDFPNSKQAPLSTNAVTRLMNRYNFQ
jgi:hypothetical protein